LKSKQIRKATKAAGRLSLLSVSADFLRSLFFEHKDGGDIS
jgi:hypothetical protein